jgi:hypothetical protein
VQKILVDRHQLVAQRNIKMLDNFRIAFHDTTFWLGIARDNAENGSIKPCY